MLPVTKVILDILRKWLKENLIPITFNTCQRLSLGVASTGQWTLL